MHTLTTFTLFVLSLALASHAQWVRYEAEQASLSGSATIESDAAASQGSYVAIGTSGRIDFTVIVPQDEVYLLRFSNKGSSSSNRNFENISINNTKVIEQQYSSGYFWDPAQTGHYTSPGELASFNSFKAELSTYGNSNDPWQISQRWWGHTGEKRNTKMEVNLKAGSNTISVIKNWGGTKWDYLEIDTAYPTRELTVSYTIHTQNDNSPISPLIYGSSVRFDIVDDALTMMRFGGNLTSPYNWENNYTNAGHDWYHTNSRFGWPSGAMAPGQENVPGSIITYHHDRSLARGFESLVAVSMIGYVAADGNGVVSESETAPSPRWKETRFKKNAPFCDPPGSPDTTDEFVYSDELIHFLVSKYGNASTPQGIKYYALDNEPRLWNSTHVRIHPDTITGSELISRSTQLATAIKDVDPYAKIFGPVFYGIWPMFNLQNPSDWEKIKKEYSWFVDYYLDEMKNASDTYGSRLMDVFTFHYYSHTSKEDTTAEYIRGRLQAPRSLWDNEYNANPLLPRLQSSIDQYNPGTTIGVTEWAFGGDNHVSGGIATADVLGIFGKYGLFQSSYWTLKQETIYPNAAFRLYRNYDGQGATFGDTKVSAELSDKISSSIYASTFSNNPEQVNMIVLNKDLTKEISGTFTINSTYDYGSAKVWGFDQSSPNIVELAPVTGITNNQFTYTLPPLTAFHFVLEKELSTNYIPSSQSQPEVTANHTFSIENSNNTFHIRFLLHAEQFVQIQVFDLFGKPINTPHSGSLPAGAHTVLFHSQLHEPGVYLVQFSTHSQKSSRLIWAY